MKSTQATHKRFLSIQTTAFELGVDPETVRRAIHRGELPAVRIGRVFRIPREVLDKWREGDGR